MSEMTPVSKNEDEGMPVPHAWRSILSAIVDAIKDQDFEVINQLRNVVPISKQEMFNIRKNIETYGATLIDLSEETWKTSVCRWIENSWMVLVDLFTAEEGPSDLVLFVKVFEDGPTYRFQVDSVHVP